MRLKMLYEMSINALSKDRGLYKLCNKMRPEKVDNILFLYYKTIFESRTDEGIFWILPNRDGIYHLAFFPDHQYDTDDLHILMHEDLWNRHIAPLIGDQFNIPQNKLKNLYAAFPRGRLEAGDSVGTYRIGFGGDYPPGWNEKQLFQRLKVHKGNCGLEIDEHWKVNPKHLQIFKSLLKK